MKIYETKIIRFIQYLSGGDDKKREEIIEYYIEFLLTEVKIQLYNTHIALMECKSFDEIAEEFTKMERKKRPLTSDAVRKRYEKLVTTIKESLEEKYGKS